MKKITIFGCPFDRTSTYKRGSRFGPKSIRRLTLEIEDYSLFLNRTLDRSLVSDAGDLKISDLPTEKALEMIEKKTKDILSSGAVPFALGGEHLISLPVVTALKKKYRDLKVIYIDAHCDLKESYAGLTVSHATVGRRIVEEVGKKSFFLFGARSGEKGEFRFAKKNGFLYNFSARDMKKALRLIGRDPVYITVDLDIFDPGIFPGTGVAEPGGISYMDFVKFIKGMQGRLNIAGMDAVELSPPCDASEASSFLAATAVREMLLAATAI